jgi:exonuclease VII small subunit
MNPKPKFLEDKLTRLQEIQQLLEQKKVSLSESLPLLEEAFKLKEEIEKELSNMENRLVALTRPSQDTQNEL